MKEKKEALVVVGIIISALVAFGFFGAPVMENASAEDAVVVIKPVFTLSAYQHPGFYDYYCTTSMLYAESPRLSNFCATLHNQTCDTSCLTVPLELNDSKVEGTAQSFSSINALKEHGYTNFITDIDVDKNPAILDKYSRIIVLHSEYVTQTEYDALSTHKNITFMFPNALYALISVNYDKNTITLLKGHAYKGVDNAFNWKYDNSKEEQNYQCIQYPIYRELGNGDKQLICNPEMVLSDHTALPTFLILQGLK